MIRTPTELMAERIRLGLSRKELAELTDDAESFIRRIEHTKCTNISVHVVKGLEKLAGFRLTMQNRFVGQKSPTVLITYHSDDDLDQNGSAWDKIAPTASFHRALCSHLASVLRPHYEVLLIAFNYPLFTAWNCGGEDTPENRRAWALDRAAQYRITEEN
jgi:transcriptional regulator with XRE-family HTH domain